MSKDFLYAKDTPVESEGETVPCSAKTGAFPSSRQEDLRGLDFFFFFLACLEVRFKACKELDRFYHVKA